MKKLFKNFLGLALSVMVLASCSQVATFEQADLTPEELTAAKSGNNLTPNGTGNENARTFETASWEAECITSEASTWFTKTSSSSGTTALETVTISYYNTPTHMVYSFSGANLGCIKLTNKDGSQITSPYSVPLPSGWKKGNVINQTFWVATNCNTNSDANSNATLIATSYNLVGICTTTTIAKNSEASVCVEDGIVNLTGTVTALPTVTGGIIKIQQFNGVSYVDVASEAVGDGILVYAFDPTVAGTYTFRASYDGSGSNGFNNSTSPDITVEAVNCEVACTESFSYVDNGDSEPYVFSYTPAESVIGAKLVFTFAQGVAETATGLNDWSINGSTRQKSMDLVACTTYTWTVDLTPDCSGNSANSNVWTDFNVNGESKKNSETPTIVESCSQ